MEITADDILEAFDFALFIIPFIIFWHDPVALLVWVIMYFPIKIVLHNILHKFLGGYFS